MCPRLGVSAHKSVSLLPSYGELLVAGFSALPRNCVPRVPRSWGSGEQLACIGRVLGGKPYSAATLPVPGGLGPWEGRVRVSACPTASQGWARRRLSQGWAGRTPAQLAGLSVGACHRFLT